MLGENDPTLQALIDRVEPDLLHLFGTSEIVYIGKEFLRADANGDGELDQEEILEILHAKERGVYWPTIQQIELRVRSSLKLWIL